MERSYVKGDAVSFGGGWWIAQKATKGERPGEGATGWRLAAKGGRDGKAGPVGPAGAPGKDGKDGQNMNQKW